MIEPEIAFIDLNQLMMVIEAFLKTVIKNVMTNCANEIEFCAKTKPDIKNRLENLIKHKFEKIEYRKAIDLLKDAVIKGHKFDDSDISFGKDLASEHERYICEQVFNAPVFIYNYPKGIKAFYMKVNDDALTVAACDLLVPSIGEIIGGSQREDDYDKLLGRCKELNIDITSIQ
jgi:asparaginyl-tRNA synthetase